MEKKFISLLVSSNKDELDFISFNEANENVIDGILFNRQKTEFYSIYNGVPIMFRNKFHRTFYEKYKNLIENYVSIEKLDFSIDNQNWSFSGEWSSFDEDKMEKTWSYTLDERYKRFLYENRVSESALPHLNILDAGCGNGTHTLNLASKGVGQIVGIDYSESVYAAENKRTSKNLFFVRGDVQSPPFRNEHFDLIFSNGVIHHTPNTYNTFRAILPIVKSGGSLYLWLYNRQGGIRWSLKRRFFDVSRWFICRTPIKVQNFFVHLYTYLIWFSYKLLRKKIKLDENLSLEVDFNDLKINMWDSITPRWRHYHEPLEVWYWYINNGFDPPMFTSWETLYGYGVLGYKKS